MSVQHWLAGVPLRAARWSAIHPWRAIGGWLAFVCVAVGLAAMIPTHQTSDADYRIGDSGRAASWVHEAGMAPLPTEDVLVTARHGARLDHDEADAAAHRVAARMRSLDEVVRVAPPQWSPDRSAVLVDIELVRGTDDVGALEAVTHRVQQEHPRLRIRQAGDVSVGAGVDDRVSSDLASAEGVSLPITLVLMLLAFGALIAAGIPVLIAGTSVAATIGLTAPLSHLVHAEPTVSSMIVLIGMAVGVDYSLFYLKREREERARGRATVDAVEIAARTSGHSILVSGLAVIASMAGLYVVGGATFDSLATGSILVVAIAVLGSITVLPALLSKLGRFVDRPRIPLLWRANRRLQRRLGHGGISRRVLGPVLRHPVAAVLAGATVMVGLAVPALGMTIHESNLDTLPASIPQVQSLRAMESGFPSQAGRADVVVKAPAAQRDAVRSALQGLRADAVAGPDFVGGPASGPASGSDSGSDSAVDRPGAPIQVSADGTVSVLPLTMAYDASDGRADRAIEHLRDRLVPGHLAGPLGADAVVGGDVAHAYDVTHRLRTYTPVVVGAVLLLTMLMMGLSFRSLRLALLSTVLNLASVGAAFGLLTLVFQHGWFEGALDFHSPGFIIDWLPLFILVVLVGLSMDYHVFVLSRVREHRRRGLPARLAVHRGVTDTAGVVASAAAVMVSVFAIFATLSMLEMKMIGVGLASAVLLDATVVRQVLLPAALVLLGDRAWGRRPPSPPAGEPVVEIDPAYELVAR